MNKAIIENHNAFVGPDDDWFHLGDFIMGNPKSAAGFLERLNGNKYMIAGNHDKKTLFKRDDNFNLLIKPDIIKKVKWIKDYHEMWVKDSASKKQFVILFHYAMRVWNGSHRDSFMLFGHSHSNLPDDPNALSIDVGIDAQAARLSKNGILNPQDYRPISFNEVEVIMNNKKATREI